jgi:hypothetical protein
LFAPILLYHYLNLCTFSDLSYSPSVLPSQFFISFQIGAIIASCQFFLSCVYFFLHHLSQNPYPLLCNMRIVRSTRDSNWHKSQSDLTDHVLPNRELEFSHKANVLSYFFLTEGTKHLLPLCEILKGWLAVKKVNSLTLYENFQLETELSDWIRSPRIQVPVLQFLQPFVFFSLALSDFPHIFLCFLHEQAPF